MAHDPAETLADLVLRFTDAFTRDALDGVRALMARLNA